MTLLDILKAKGSTVFTIPPQFTLQEATQEMVRRNVGALLVCQRDVSHGERLLGIVTERDILRFSASDKGPLADFRVADIMTTRLLTASPNDSVEQAMGVMTQHRIRHLPVLSEGHLVGIVSLGDLVKNQLERLAVENQFLKSYITG